MRNLCKLIIYGLLSFIMYFLAGVFKDTLPPPANTSIKVSILLGNKPSN